MKLNQIHGRDLQLAVLETFIKMREKVPTLQKYTHIRAERSNLTIHWSLLRADSNTVYEQRRINFGDDANTAMWRIMDPYVIGQKYDVARITMAFDPHPAMSIDILDDHNNPIISHTMITIEVAHD